MELTHPDQPELHRHPHYPEALEAWWINRAASHLETPEDTRLLQKLLPRVRDLSDHFTLRRADGAPSCYEHNGDVLAYGLFFFPQTHTRLRFIAREWIETSAWNPPTEIGRPLRVLDLGCGSGAASHAVLTEIGAHFPGTEVKLVGVDRSVTNLDTARDLFRAQPPHGMTFTSNQWMRRDVTGSGFSWKEDPFCGPWDIILMGFSFGEFAAGLETEAASAAIREVTRTLREDGILMMAEPALQETSERLEAIRDDLATRSDLRLLAPCLHQHPCPARAGGHFWCHEVRRWSPPPSLVWLNSTLHRDIRFLKFSFFVVQNAPALTPAPDHSSHHHFRLVSPIARQPGQLVCKGCAASGKIQTVEWLTRHLTKEQIKNDLGLERGDRLHLPHLKELGTPGRYRIPADTAPPHHR